MTTLGPSSSRFTPAFTFSAIALVIAALAVLVSLPSLASALLGPGPDDDEMRDVFTAFASDQHLEAQQADIDRINGRSVFYRPSPRPKYRPTPPPRIVEKPDEPAVIRRPEPTKPTRYGGPDITAVVVDEVWFGDTIVRVGETVGDITVLSVENAPFSVKLEWQGWSGDVDFISRTAMIADSRNGGGVNRLGGIMPADELSEEELRQRTAEGAKKAAASRSGSMSAPAPRNRGNLTPEQRRRARQSDPNPSVPDE